MNNQDFLGLGINAFGITNSSFSLADNDFSNVFEELNFDLDFSSSDPMPLLPALPPSEYVFVSQDGLLQSNSGSDASNTTLFYDCMDYQDGQVNGENFEMACVQYTKPILVEANHEMSHSPPNQPEREAFNCRASSSKENKRRNWESSIILFSANPGSKVKPKKRKRFSEARKYEVALNRKIGACLHCKLKRLSCNFGIPCDYCLKRAGDVGLGQQICSRRNLVSTRFDDIDLFELVKWEQKIEALKRLPITGQVHHLYVGYCTKDKDDIAHAYLRLPVMQLKDPRYNTIKMVSWDYYKLKEKIVPSSNTLIAWEGLPTTDQLIAIWANSYYNFHPTSEPFESLRTSIKEFAELYCRRTGEVPLKYLVGKAFRLHNLFSILQSGLYMRIKPTPESDEEEFISDTLWKQLRYTISKDVVKLELEVLFEMDKLLFGAETIGRQNPIGLWLCLWTLILTYKEHMIMTSNWKETDYHVYDLSRHMYNTLTSIYSALYKTTSPLTLDWRTDGVADMLDRDPELIRHFCYIKTEIYWIQSETKFFRPEDNIFKRLVLENENRLLEAHKKVARKQGILRREV
ncbi:hypothetical protein B0J14DRAFT_316756 [Halenospora varia]|nr:hypothetical protein B0J14DRAFT_316756 [Halenospora varia]